MCVFWEGGRGDAQGPPATLQPHQKAAAGGREGRAGTPQPLSPPFPGERAFPLAFWRRGLGVFAILARSWKNKSLPRPVVAASAPSLLLLRVGVPGAGAGLWPWGGGAQGVAEPGGPARALGSPLARLSFTPKIRAERLGVFIPAV